MSAFLERDDHDIVDDTKLYVDQGAIDPCSIDVMPLSMIRVCRHALVELAGRSSADNVDHAGIVQPESCSAA